MKKLGIYKKNDIRGSTQIELTPERMILMGKLIAEQLGFPGLIALGIDPRSESFSLKSALISGLTSQGVNVADMGIVTTPATYFAAASDPDVNASIMITASHNPLGTSGMKVSNEKGEAFHYDNFYKYLEEKEKDKTSLSLKYGGRILLEKGRELAQNYLLFLEKRLFKGISKRMAIEFGSGSTYIFQEVLRNKQIEFVGLRPVPNSRFPTLLPDPAKDECYVELSKVVSSLGLDYGLAFDADGDRFGATDDKGIRISPDKMTMILGLEAINSSDNKTVLIDVKTSLATKKFLEEHGAIVEYTKVGHSWVHETILKTKAIFAGELSGHYYFAGDYYGFDDALYSAVKFINFVEKLDIPLSEYVASLPSYNSTPEIRIKREKEEIENILEKASDLADDLGAKKILIDGVRAELDDGWFLIRASGTEAALSYRVEAVSKEKLEELKDILQEKLEIEF